MKYVWTGILMILLSCTWALGGNDRNERLAQMSDRQFELAEIITQSIREKRPEVTGVNFSQLYTEVISPDREMLAHYRYEITAHANDEITTEVVEGSSRLRSENGVDWLVVSSDMREPTIGFQKGETVTREQE